MMNDMVNYIFNSLSRSERRLDIMARTIRKQRKINNQLSIFVVLTTANLVALHMEQDGQAKRIKQLEKEIEELKYPEGE